MDFITALRCRIALAICPELRVRQSALADAAPEIGRQGQVSGPKAPEHSNYVGQQRLHLIRLADVMAAHQGVTHFAISMRAVRKGDFFKRLKERGGDCRTQTASRLMRWFSDNWPADLEWPADIPRPTPSKKEAA